MYQQTDSNKLLVKFGSWLDSIDACQEYNGAGFNKFDKGSWHYIDHTDETSLKRMLKKYKKQLVSEFGSQEFKVSGLATFVDKVMITGEVEIGHLVLYQSGRPSKDVFASLIETYKNHGFKFNTISKKWRLPEKKWNNFKDDEFESQLEDLDIEVNLPYLYTDLYEEEDVYVPELKISYDKQKKLFSIQFSYDYEAADFFSNSSGRLTGITEYNHYHQTRETYSIALVNEILEKFPKEFKDWKITLPADFKALNKAEEKRQAGYCKPIPAIAKKLAKGLSLFPYQNEGVKFLDQTNGNALLGLEMGLGKTLCSLAWCVKEKKRALVVCPKTVRKTWLEEADKFFPKHFKTLELTPKIKNQTIDFTEYDLVSVNYESLNGFAHQLDYDSFDVLILDESHRVKNHKAGITTLVQHCQKFFAHKILLSGTTIKNRKNEIYTQINLINRDLFRDRREVTKMTTGGLWNRIQSCYISKQKKDVMAQLPDIQTTIIKEKVPNLPDSRGFSIDQISRYKADVAIAKAAYTVEFVKEILDSSDSNVLLYTDSVEAAKKMVAKLGKMSMLHHGQMSDKDREKCKKDFQTRKTDARVFVTTRQSFGVGVTLTAADKVVFNDLPWNPADVMQAEARAHRIGQQNNVNVYWMTAENNDFDELVTSIMFTKYPLTKKVNEGKQLSAKDAKWMKEHKTTGCLSSLFKYGTPKTETTETTETKTETKTLKPKTKITPTTQKEKIMSKTEQLAADLNSVFEKHGIKLVAEPKAKATKATKPKAEAKATKKAKATKPKAEAKAKATKPKAEAKPPKLNKDAYSYGDMVVVVDFEDFTEMVQSNASLAGLGKSHAEKYREAMTASRNKKKQPHPGFVKKVHQMLA